jgi:hypothetical protein
MPDLNSNPMDWIRGRMVDEGEKLPPREPARVPRGIQRRPTPGDMPRQQTLPAAKFSDPPHGPQGAHSSMMNQGQGGAHTVHPAQQPGQRRLPQAAAQTRPVTEQERMPLQRNQLDVALKGLIEQFPDQELHYSQWFELLRDAGTVTTDKSINAGLARLERDRVWGVTRPRAGVYVWHPEEMMVSSLMAPRSEVSMARRRFMRPVVTGQVIQDHQPAWQQAQVTPLPLPDPVPVPDPVPNPDPVPEAAYGKRSVFRFVGDSADGTIVLQDPAGRLFKAWPL